MFEAAPQVLSKKKIKNMPQIMEYPSLLSPPPER
jgi:hypothetical protein